MHMRMFTAQETRNHQSIIVYSVCRRQLRNLIVAHFIIVADSQVV
jgi:hypothetical protein